jgi:hypothetical protein
MKKILSMVALAATAALMSSCVIEEQKECEKNKTGEITVVNANPFAIQVDVINSETGALNEIRPLAANESTTYTMAAGKQATIQVKPAGWTWTDVGYRTPVECGTETYSWEYCNFRTNSYAKLVSIKNNTGYKSVVDIGYGSQQWAGEIILENNETAYYYNVRAGNIYFWHRYFGQTTQTTSDWYTVGLCGTLNFTWNASGLKNGIITSETKQVTEYKPFESLGVSNIVK